MASIIPGYEYDIFISYRQKDNKYDGWVTEFVNNLQRELEATFKEEISIYFDVNPHDGLLETHDVDASLKDKLKCLVFIPVLSRTYCDPRSFAWEHEFIAFIGQASEDRFGLKVKLPDGNVSSRVLPVKIHDLDSDDIRLCESILDGVLRGVEFIYKSPGVNRPLRSMEDKPHDNLNKTIYRDQINKVANAIREIVSGISSGKVVSGEEKMSDHMPWEELKKATRIPVSEKPAVFKKWKLVSGMVVLIITATILIKFLLPYLIRQNPLERLRSSGKKISVVVMPFQNMINDTTWNTYQENIQQNIISALACSDELFVRRTESIKELLQRQNIAGSKLISHSIASMISNKLDADIFIYGNIQRKGTKILLTAQLTDTKSNKVLKSFERDGPYKEETIFDLIDTLRREIMDYLLISKLLRENPLYGEPVSLTTKSPEALKFYILGNKASEIEKNQKSAVEWHLMALKQDSNYFDPMMGLSDAYARMGQKEKNIQWVLKYYNKREQWPYIYQLAARWAFATHFESPEAQVEVIRKQLQIDDQYPNFYYILGWTYNRMDQPDKAIPELERSLELWQKRDKDNMKYLGPYYWELGNAYHNTGQFKKEGKLYRRVEKITDDSSIDLSMIYGNQAILAFAEKDTNLASSYIDKFISARKKNSANDAGIKIGVASIYSRAGITDKAEEYYRDLISLQPDNPARLNLFVTFLMNHNLHLEEASEIMDRLMKSTPDRFTYYQYLDTKGWILYKQGKYREALEILERTWNEAPFKLYSIKSHLEEVKKVISNQSTS